MTYHRGLLRNICPSDPPSSFAIADCGGVEAGAASALGVWREETAGEGARAAGGAEKPTYFEKSKYHSDQ